MPTTGEFAALTARVAALEAHVGITVPEPDAGTYTVVAGDTLSSIAGRFLVTVADLVEWNSIPDPDRIAVGMVLVVADPGEEETPEPQGPPVPVGTTLFADDFEGGNLARWVAVQTAPTGDKRPGREVPGHLELVARSDGGTCLLVTRPRGGGERSEVLAGGECRVRDGDTRLLSITWTFPADFPTPRGRWFIVHQQHAGQTVGGSPAFCIEVDRQDRLVIRNNRTNDAPTVIGSIDRGVTHRYDIAVKYSTDGWVQVWRDGVEVVPRTDRVTWPAQGDFKVGVYTGGDDVTARVYVDDVRFARLS